MATTVIGALSVEITADTKGVKKGIKSTGEALGVLGKKVRTSANQWAKWGAAAALAAGVAAAAIVRGSLSSIRELSILAEAGNVTVKEFQQMAFAAEQYGISQEKLGDILKDFTERVGEFVSIGSGPMIDFFEKIAPQVGITEEAFKGLSGKEGLQLYVDSLEKANLSQEEMTFFMETMAGDAVRLLPLLSDNGKAMFEFARAAEELGIGLSEIDVAKAIEAEKTLGALATVTSNQLMIVAAELAPLITAIGEEFLKSAKDGNNFARTVFSGVTQVGRAFAVLADGIHGIQIIFKGLELVANGVIAVLAIAFAGLIKIIDNTINTILEGWRLLFKEMGNLVRPLNEGMATMFDDIAGGIDDLKLNGAGFFEEFANAQVDAIRITKEELHNLAMEKLPTQRFDEFVEHVKERSKEIAEATSAALAGKKAEEDEEENTFELSVEEKQFENDIMLGIQAVFEAQKTAKAQEEADRRAAIATQERVKAINDAQTMAQGVLSIGELFGKKSEKALKKRRKASVIINAAAGIARAWAENAWPVALGISATIAAGAAKQIASINSATSVSATTGSSSVSTSTPNQAQPNTPDRTLTVDFQGSGLMNVSQVRALMGQIDEQIGDGFQIRTLQGGV